MDRVPVISVDGHVKAPRATYGEYMDRAFRDVFDDWLQSVEGDVDGFIRPELGEEAQWDARRRLDDLATQGVVAEVLFPNGVAFGKNRVDFSLGADLTRQGNMAYNRWLLDFCSEAPERLLGQALVAFDDVEEAVRDVKWAHDQGFGGIVMPPLHPESKYFFDRDLDPIWAACVETGLPLSQHGGTGAPDFGPLSFPSIMTLATEHSFFSGRSLWQMIYGGVFERFPELRIVFVETEAWWIGPMIEHMDSRMSLGDEWDAFAAFMRAEGGLSKLPSEYWASNCYAGISPFHTVQLSIEHLGERGGEDASDARFHIRSDNAMFGVDYPHFESVFPDTAAKVASLVTNPHVSELDARKVLYENAAEVYHFDMTALQPLVDEIGYELDRVAAMTV